MMFVRPRDFARAGVVIAALGAAMIVGGPAWAQGNEVESLTQSIRQLETQLRVLQREVYRGDPPARATAAAEAPAPAVSSSSPAVSQLQLRLDQFEQEMRALTGQLEQVGFEMRQVGARLDKLVGDVDFRLRRLEGGAPPEVASNQAPAPSRQSVQLTPPSSAPAPQSVTVAPRSSTPGVLGQLTESQLRRAGVESDVRQASLTPDNASQSVGGGCEQAGSADDQYECARGLLLQRDIPGAEQALRKFISANPGNDLAGNAQYWLGETFYVRQNYLEAARMFAEGYQEYPASTKAPDNLLKLGLSLAALDRKNDACITLARLTAEYGNAPANILQRAQREQQRLGCG